MHLQESGEMYLETIHVLSERQSLVRSLDVANHMHYSKPSVSRAMKLLKENGYLDIDEDGGLHLTDAGRDVATKIYERHNVLSDLLMKLGVSKETAVEDACRMEHYISDTSFEAVKRALAENDF